MGEGAMQACSLASVCQGGRRKCLLQFAPSNGHVFVEFDNISCYTDGQTVGGGGKGEEMGGGGLTGNKHN